MSWITIVANLGAIAGGLAFGHWSEKIGRVNAITIAALIALPALPLWAYASTPALLALGAFIMQVAVQGAWGVVPAHLNELTPGAARATIPAFVYQAGNFLASYNGPFQARIAEANGGDYSYALALVAGVVAVAIIVVIRFSPEKRGGVMTVATRSWYQRPHKQRAVCAYKLKASKLRYLAGAFCLGAEPLMYAPAQSNNLLGRQ